ncbi:MULTISPECIES: hypothetical protein [Halorussus]|uniref:hypothetical protein n=1 Tax=Halorussus TaxID=1070314 RepID=UPI00209ED859|nr:hypothetical protein [Halorussus vallis]USZ78601.1 hypothetical protein NGM07_24955 [Halorussus vallis]
MFERSVSELSEPKEATEPGGVERPPAVLIGEYPVCLQLYRESNTLYGNTATAFVQYDPTDTREGEQFYWYESGEDDFGRQTHRDGYVSREVLQSLLESWTVVTRCLSEEMAAFIVEDAPETWWFWARDFEGLKAHIKAAYHRGLYVASTRAHTGTLAIGNLWPETQSDSDERRRTLESCVFYRTRLYEGHGFYAVELPRPDLLRNEFRTVRPNVATPETCGRCGTVYDESVGGCDWCGWSPRVVDPSFGERVRERARRVAGRAASYTDRARATCGQAVRRVRGRVRRVLGDLAARR